MWQMRVELTRNDKVELNRMIVRPLGLRILAWLGLSISLASVACGVGWLFDESLREKAPGLIACGMMWLFLPGIVWLSRLDPNCTWGLLLTPTHDYALSIDEEGVEVDRLFGNDPDKLDWVTFMSFHVTENLWVLEKCIHPKRQEKNPFIERYLIIPKRSVPPERATEFCGFLRDQLKK
jgi:hypothetical protein